MAAHSLGKSILEESPAPDMIPTPGQLVQIHYDGRLEDGSVYHSTRDSDKPLEFVLGEEEVMDGLDILVGTMALGERAELTIPPEYAYGDEGKAPLVPPNATLFLDVQVIAVGKLNEEGQLFDEKAGNSSGSTSSPARDATAQQTVDDVPANGASSHAAPPTFWNEETDEREGGDGEGYTWEATGSGRDILISVPVAAEVKARDLQIDVRTWSVKFVIAGKLVLEGKLWGEVDMDESHWDLDCTSEGEGILRVYMTKLQPDLRWQSLLKVEPQSVQTLPPSGATAAEAATVIESVVEAPALEAEVVDAVREPLRQSAQAQKVVDVEGQSRPRSRRRAKTGFA